MFMSIVAGITIFLCLPRSGHFLLQRSIPFGSPATSKVTFLSTASAFQRTSHVFKTKQLSTMAEHNDNSTRCSKKYIDKLALILVNEKRQQLVARSRGKTAFFTPGGKREGNECDTDALCRECKEELTIDLVRESIQKYGVFEAQAFGKPPGTMVRMTCYTSSFVGDLKPQSEVEELRWIDSSCSRELLTETGIMILEDLKERDLID